MTPYRPIPGKLTVNMVNNSIMSVKGYGTDVSGEYVELKTAGSYGSTLRLPLSCIRPLTDEERAEEGQRGSPCRAY